MSQDTLKDYTLQTLTFGEEFLNKLNGTQLPENLSSMHNDLLKCFKELKTVWKSVTKHAFKLTGNCNMDKLKLKLNEREKMVNTMPTLQMNKCMSLTDILRDKDSELEIDEDTVNRTKTPTPTYTNVLLPRVPTKKTRVKLKSSFSIEPRMKLADRNESSLLPVQRMPSPENQASLREKSLAMNSLPLISTENITDNGILKKATFDVPSCEQGYIKLKEERRLPPVTKFTKVLKTKNVWINHWQLGERYCGIADDILYIFFSFKETHAEISMELINLYIGKGFGNKEEQGNTVLFQSREVHLILLFSSEKLQEEFYKISFNAQNRNALQQSLQPSVPSPIIPKPYAKKPPKQQYLNFVREPQQKVSYPQYDCQQSTSTIDSGEEDYVDMMQSSQQLQNSY